MACEFLYKEANYIGRFHVEGLQELQELSRRMLKSCLKILYCLTRCFVELLLVRMAK
jgi:hypothetical protein